MSRILDGLMVVFFFVALYKHSNYQSVLLCGVCGSLKIVHKFHRYSPRLHNRYGNDPSLIQCWEWWSNSLLEARCWSRDAGRQLPLKLMIITCRVDSARSISRAATNITAPSSTRNVILANLRYKIFAIC